MTDTTTKKRFRLSGDGSVGQYLKVPLLQLKEVRGLLDSHQVRYWVDENAISLNGQPAVAFINFSGGTDGKKVQEILDSVS